MTALHTVAALYVATGGAYFGLDGVDPWDASRDARLYAGPYPVVAHLPCERWGKYATGGPAAPRTRTRGDDGGCFAAALASVREWGGVLEHPQGSAAWAAHGLTTPPRAGGWVSAGDWRGWTCCVEQGHYGHPARKATWLYAVGCDLPDLPRGPAPETWRGDTTRSERWRARRERRRVRAPVPQAACGNAAGVPRPAGRDGALGVERSEGRMTAMHTAEQRSVARAWLHRHGFTAARLVEDLAHAAASAHGNAEAAHVEREDAELARLVEDLRGWIQRAESYVARREGER